MIEAITSKNIDELLPLIRKYQEFYETPDIDVMNDLYTLPSYRGTGIGRQLIKHCLHFALSQGATRLQWLTAEDNALAQELYDSLNTKKSTWCVYTYTP
jgi:GNAT superfamily N-acetyltransferase